MYEFWLMLNILFEIAREFAPWLVGAALLWAVGMAFMRQRLGGARRAMVSVGLGGALLAFLLLPFLTQSSLRELSYWVDWASLAGMALGFGVAGALLAWPLLALRQPR